MRAKGITVNLGKAMMPDGHTAKDRAIMFDPDFEMFEGAGHVKILASGHWMLFGRTCFDFVKAPCFPVLEAAVKTAGAAASPGRWKFDGGLDTKVDPFPFQQVLPRSGRYGIVDPFEPSVTRISFHDGWHGSITLKASVKRVMWDSTTGDVEACDDASTVETLPETAIALPYFFGFDKLGARLAIPDFPGEDTRLLGLLVLHPTDFEAWGVLMPVAP